MIKQNLIASSKLREMIYSLTFSIVKRIMNIHCTAIKAEQMFLIHDKKQIVLVVQLF